MHVNIIVLCYHEILDECAWVKRKRNLYHSSIYDTRVDLELSTFNGLMQMPDFMNIFMILYSPPYPGRTRILPEALGINGILQG